MHDDGTMTPTWRKPFGMLVILLLIFGWAGIVGSQSDRIAALPALVQGLVYGVAGIVWIAPLKPLLRWMELGGQQQQKDTNTR